MKPDRRRRRALWGAIALAWPLAAAADAAPWPAAAARPIRLIVAYPPGGVSDEAARTLAEQLAADLLVPVTVEHRPGAGGAVAMEALAHAAPDGHTLVFSAISPLLMSPPGGRAAIELATVAPVFSVMLTPMLLVATPAFSGRDVDGVLQQARLHPGALRWATSGLATTGHLVLEQVRAARQVDITHVPYKGGGQQLTDALSGQFELLSTNVGAQQLAFIRQGRLRALAVGAPARLAVLPEVPTFAELGLPQANLASLFGVFAPAGTPVLRIERLNAAFNLALRRSSLQARLLAVNNLPTGGSSADFLQQIQRAIEASRASAPR